MSTATKKMNGTSKKQTSKKSGSIAGNKPTKKYSRNGIEDISFNMTDVEKTRRKQKESTAEIYSAEVRKLLKDVSKFTLTDHEERVDYAEIKLFKNRETVIIKDGKVIKDLEDLILPNGKIYQCYKATLLDFNLYVTRNNGRSIKPYSPLSKTSMAYRESVVTEPDDIIWNSSKFSIECDKKEYEVREDGIYLILKGDINIRNGGNRALVNEILKRYISENNLSSLRKNLENSIQEFFVRERSTFDNDKAMNIACINQNNSTAHKDFERIRCLGALNDIPSYCGKYQNNIVLREAALNENNVFIMDFLEDIGTLDSTRYFTEFSPITTINELKDGLTGEIIDKVEVQVHCVKNVFNGDRIKQIEKSCKNGEFKSSDWFGFIEDIGEIGYELHTFLNDEFLRMIEKRVMEGVFEEEYLTTLVSSYTPGMEKFTWTKGYRKLILTAIKPLLAKDKNGKHYFKYSPIEALKNYEYLDKILDIIRDTTSIENITKSHKSKNKKASGSDYRNTVIAEKVYKSSKKYLTKYLGVKF